MSTSDPDDSSDPRGSRGGERGDGDPLATKRSPEGDTEPGRSSVLDAIGWRAVLVDVAVVAAWVAAISFAWRLVPWPTWAYYAVVFGGVLGYSLVVAPTVESVVRGS